MGLSDWIRSSPSLGSLRLDQVAALVKDLCEPSDVGDENQLLGQVVLVASKYSNDISSTQAVALAKPLQVRV
jgi:hypothetical protein